MYKHFICVVCLENIKLRQMRDSDVFLSNHGGTTTL